MKKKYLAAFAAAVAVFAAGCVYLYGSTKSAEQKSVLKGTVCAEELVQADMKVRTGAVLVRVRSVTGSSIAAARADRDGTVRRVLVQPGDTVVPQQTVVILEE